MINHKNNYNLYDENSIFQLAVSSVMGDREDQQDSCGYELKNEEGLIVLCDGMGGHEGGKTASTIATEHMLENYCNSYPCVNPHVLLVDAVNECDDLVSELKRNDGTPMHAGSTIVGVIVKDNVLYWISVGDSRIYILRKDELVQITVDHIYRNVLEEQLKNKELSEEEYNKKIKEGEALVSFLGRKGLPYIDTNDIPFKLCPGDRILLMSDGLYKIVPDESIKNILLNFENINEALGALQLKVQKFGKNTKQDNTTIALIKIK